jgi:signal transduction histidine kinase
MKIKNQFTICIVVFSFILLVIAASVATAEQQIAQLNAKKAISSDIEQGVSRLNSISVDYFLYQEDIKMSQWQSQFSTLQNDLSNLKPSSSEEQILVNNTTHDLQTLSALFGNLTAYLQSAPRNVSVRIDPAFQIRWSSMALQSQTLVSEVNELSQSLDNQARLVNQTNILFIISLVGTFGALLGTIYFMVFRKTLKSVTKLQKGISVIGSGNLDYNVDAGEKDEISDISKSVNQMAANLKAVTKQLKDSERLAAIGATAGMVGHDIRNPLQAITGDLYLAKTDLSSIPESEEKQAIQESLVAIENNVDYINKIVQDLQDYARPLNPKPEEADLKLIITKLFEKNNMPDNIELSVKVENSAEKISTDSYYINRIMYNLINNAVQAMPNGGKLTLDAFRGPKDLVMTVKDTGVGIPKEVQGKLFTPMFTTKSKGQGFGLPVVKRMTESLGGTVTFESEEGKGTTFTVRLPLTQ